MVTSLNTSSPARDAGTQQVQYLRKRITFSNVASTVTIGTIPAGASVVTGGVHIVTAFNATTTNVMNIGFIGASTNASAYGTAITTGAVGYIALDELGATSNVQGTVPHTITASPTETGAASTAGTADVMVGFILNNDL